MQDGPGFTFRGGVVFQAKIGRLDGAILDIACAAGQPLDKPALRVSREESPVFKGQHAG